MILEYEIEVAEDYYDTFEYEIDYSEIKDALEDMSQDDVVKCANEIFSGYSEEEKKEFIEGYLDAGYRENEILNDDGSVNFDFLYADDRDTVLEILADNADYDEEIKEFLHMYFSEAAYAQHEDDELYRKDPYAYYGISPNDFH